MVRSMGPLISSVTVGWLSRPRRSCAGGAAWAAVARSEGVIVAYDRENNLRLCRCLIDPPILVSVPADGLYVESRLRKRNRFDKQGLIIDGRLSNPFANCVFARVVSGDCQHRIAVHRGQFL